MKVNGQLHASATLPLEKVRPAPGWGPQPAGQYGERRIEPRFLSGPACDLVTIPTALYRSSTLPDHNTDCAIPVQQVTWSQYRLRCTDPASVLVTIPTALYRSRFFKATGVVWRIETQVVNNKSIDRSINQSACTAILRVTFTEVKQSEWDVHLKLLAGVRGYVPPCPLHSFMELQ